MEDFWYEMEMEWKKIASMEYGKIVLHSIPCPVSVYYAIVFPHLMYGILLWGCSSKNNLHKLQMLQNKCLRIIECWQINSFATAPSL